jgi:hypothetical protein
MCNIWHQNDRYLLSIKSLSFSDTHWLHLTQCVTSDIRMIGISLPIKSLPFSDSHWLHLNALQWPWPTAGVYIYTSFMQRSQIHYSYSRKPLFDTLIDLSVRASVGTNSPPLTRVEEEHRRQTNVDSIQGKIRCEFERIIIYFSKSIFNLSLEHYSSLVILQFFFNYNEYKYCFKNNVIFG